MFLVDNSFLIVGRAYVNVCRCFAMHGSFSSLRLHIYILESHFVEVVKVEK